VAFCGTNDSARFFKNSSRYEKTRLRSGTCRDVTIFTHPGTLCVTGKKGKKGKVNYSAL
jgi:hypothetical protein